MNMLNLSPKDEYFSSELIADVLSVSKRNIEAWAKNGKLIPILDPTIHSKPYHRKQLTNFKEFNAMFNSNWEEDISVQPKRNYKLVELFAGAGGLALGLEKLDLSPYY